MRENWQVYHCHFAGVPEQEAFFAPPSLPAKGHLHCDFLCFYRTFQCNFFFALELAIKIARVNLRRFLCDLASRYRRGLEQLDGDLGEIAANVTPESRRNRR